MAQGDLARPDLNELDSSPAHRSESLSTVFSHAVSLATAAESWYATKRRSKRYWGRTLRVGAILLGTVAAVLPVLGQIFTNDGKPAIPPGWAAVSSQPRRHSSRSTATSVFRRHGRGLWPLRSGSRAYGMTLSTRGTPRAPPPTLPPRTTGRPSVSGLLAISCSRSIT